MARKTPARNSKGRFVKSGSGGGRRSRSRRSSSGSSTSTALVRAAPAQVIRVSAPRSVARRHTRRRRHHGGGAVGVSGNFLASLKAKSKGLMGSAAYGWVTQSGSETASKIKGYLDKLPSLDAIGKPATHGLGFLFVATKTKGFLRTASDAIATGALHRASFNFGASNFSLEKAAAVGDDDEMAGDMEDDRD